MVSAAEALGFTVPVVVGVASVDWSPLPAAVALLMAGAVEGATLGWAQATVLRRAINALRAVRWTALTAGAAAAAYGLSIAAVKLAGTGKAGAIATAAVLGVGLLMTLGSAQWLELRRHVARAWRWILWTAAAWLIALGAFMAIASPLWHDGQPVGNTVAVGVAAGMVMAVVQASVTGAAILSMLAIREPTAEAGQSARTVSRQEAS